MERGRVSQLFESRRKRFEACVRPHLDRLYRYALQLTQDSARAEDLVQSLLLKLYQREQRLEDLDQAGSWLARALHNLYIDEVRRHTRTPLDIADADESVLEEWPDDGLQSLESQAEQRFARERLNAAMAQLSASQRAVLAWHDIEGYSLEELARNGDIALGTLKSRLHRARARMRALLMEPCDTEERVRVGG
jgi:RNA polymerase sigma-70 factor (ECF subfamily)